MKIFLSVILITGLAGMAPAAPYIVYSGEGASNDFSSSGSATKATPLYLLTDVADTSSFALMQVDAANKVYTVNSRPSASPTTEETNNNFIDGITTTNGRSGIGTFSYGSDTTDLSNNIFISHAYSTGAATLRDTTLVPARKKALIVNLKTNGVPIGTFTFNPSPAVTSGVNAFAAKLSGVYFNYEIAAVGSLTKATTQGNFTLTENPVLTSLANIGGAYTIGKNTAAILPVTIPSGTSPADAYSAWLAAFAQLNGLSLPSSGNSEGFSAATFYSGSTVLNDGALTLTGAISSTGSGIVTVGTGVLKLNNSGLTVGVITPASVSNAFTGVLTLGGVLTPTDPIATTITQVDTTPGDSGATLTFNLGTTGTGGGTLTLTDTGALSIVQVVPTGTILTLNPGVLTAGYGTIPPTGGGRTTLGVGVNMLANGQTLTIASVTITVSAVNNGLVDGTIAYTALIPITFTGATLIIDGVNSGATLTPGAIVTGGISLAGGSMANISGVVTDTASTITVVTTP